VSGNAAMLGFLARWARRLSWRETAQVFATSWKRCTARCNGLCNGDWAAATAAGRVGGRRRNPLGQGKRAEQFLSVIYQIRQSLPPTALGRAATDAGHAAARLAGLGTGGGEGAAVCV